MNYEKEAWIWSDWLFNFRVLKKTTKFVYTEKTVYHNYISENSSTRPTKLNKNRFNEIEYVLKRFAQECGDISDDAHMLYQARSRFSARVIFGLVSYYGKFYKTDLDLKEEIYYLKKISASEITQEMNIAMGETGVSFYKLRLIFLKHHFYLAEIAYMLLRSMKGNGKK